MAQMRIALAQVNPTVGDLAGNAALVLNATKQAAFSAAHMVLFPEMMLCGYPIEDLALRPSFQQASLAAVAQLARDLDANACGDTVVIVGYLGVSDDRAPALGMPTGAPQNCLAVIHRGRVVGTYAKHHLPNYGVFDEFRNFVPGTQPLVARIAGVDVAFAICEDLWQDGGPVALVREQGAGLLVVINGSPYEQGKTDVRRALVQRRAREAGCPIAYVNMVGGQDELVFDGDSHVVDLAGNTLARAPMFDEGVMLVDLDLQEADNVPMLADGTEVVVVGRFAVDGFKALEPTIADLPHPHAEAYHALVLATRDYIRKNGFTSVALGLSGGIDSALVAVIAADAIGPEHVHCISMPSRYSSQHSRDDATDLAERIGCHLRTIAIEPMVAAYEASMPLHGLAAENLQARVRGTTLMAVSNEEGHLVLATGNKSELAVGYSTIYGDAVGGYAPIKDLLKTLVWDLARWRNAYAESRGEVPPIPESSISKPPSAELRPDQKDSDSLPEYEVLDAMLDLYVEGDLGGRELKARGFDASLVDRVLRLVDSAEYKRRQYPPGPKLSTRAFGRDRRLPITNRWHETS
ncbi:MAG: NAD+ synthase [Candidatus Nanopelagicales bacterium]